MAAVKIKIPAVAGEIKARQTRPWSGVPVPVEARKGRREVSYVRKRTRGMLR